MDPAPIIGGHVDTDLPMHVEDTDTEPTQQSPPPPWPALKFEPVDSDCRNCGTPILDSPFFLGLFAFTLMPASAKSQPAYLKENEALKAQIEGEFSTTSFSYSRR